MNGKSPRNLADNIKPPAAFAVGGLGAARLQNPVLQAPLPARVLEPLIRVPGVGTALHKIGEKLALAAEVCITLFAVEQRSKGCVKAAGRG